MIFSKSNIRCTQILRVFTKKQQLVLITRIHILHTDVGDRVICVRCRPLKTGISLHTSKQAGMNVCFTDKSPVVTGLATFTITE